MEISQLQTDELEPFVEDLWIPAQREMTAFGAYTLREEIRADGLEHRRERLARDDAVTFLAREGGRRCGFASAEVGTPPPIFQQTRECHVSELFVRESMRRQGVATALLEATETWARKQECEHMDLNVHRDNRSARAVYEAAGYEVQRYNMQKPVSE